MQTKALTDERDEIIRYLCALRGRYPANDNPDAIAAEPVSHDYVCGWQRGIEAALVLLGVKPEDFRTYHPNKGD